MKDISRVITKQYIAGFFDGEGSVSIAKRRRYTDKITEGYAQVYALEVGIGQVDDLGLFDYLISTYGGSKVLSKKGRGCWVFKVYSRPAARFLEDILPYLIIKREQAICALE